jgi:pimeloyl-ACP methyl ester carboxylesterase
MADEQLLAEPIRIVSYGRAVVRDGRTAFLVHGAGMDQSVWTLQGRYLAFHGWNALAIDLPAHGRSRPAMTLDSIEAMADWLAHVAEAGEHGPVTLIGHSMGALIALEMAARHPHLVAGLCLLGAAPRMPVHPSLLEAAARHDTHAVDLIVDWGFGYQGHLGGSRMPGGWLMGQARSLLLRCDPAVLAADLAACHQYERGEERAAAVRCRTLVIIGAEDRMTPPAAGRRLAGAIPGASLALIEGAGHMMMMERPEETLEAIVGFVG